MLTFPVPAALNGDALAAELMAAGLEAAVSVSGDQLVVDGPTQADRERVRAVIAAHVPPAATTTDPVDGLVAELSKASSVAQVKAALVKGLPSAIRGR